MEGILVRALRAYETVRDAEEREDDDAPPARGGPPRGGPEEEETPALRACIEEAIAGFRPSAQVERLPLMDLLAVKECTDARFLPKRFRSLNPPEINDRIARLKLAIGV